MRWSCLTRCQGSSKQFSVLSTTASAQSTTSSRCVSIAGAALTALAQPRWHDQLGNTTLVEFNPGHGVPSFSNATAAYLTSLRYNITGDSANAAVQSP